MKRYLNSERVLWIIAICFFVLCLSSCDTNGKMYTSPLNDFGDETNLFGWLLIWPIAWVMHAIGSIFPYGWGQLAWGIVFTTIIVRTIAWPIYAKTNDMSLKMSVAQPEMEKLQLKYANRKDPQSQQRMQQEMMALYKKYKINPLGCLMPFLQMPIFMAMYTVVRRIPLEGKLGLTDSSFLGISNCLNQGVYGDNSAPLWSGTFWVGIALAVLVGASMWLLNYIGQKKPSYAKKTPQQNNQQNAMAKQMKIMNYFMIVMMVFVALSNNGLALYWVIGNLYSLFQSILNRYLNEKKYYKMRSETDILISNK